MMGFSDPKYFTDTFKKYYGVPPSTYMKQKLKKNEFLFTIISYLPKNRTIYYYGGYAMVPLIQDEIVDKRKWIDKEDFIDLLALTQSVPPEYLL